MKILITGTAGFIGFHTVSRFLLEDYQVVGIDSLNAYYDVKLKYSRLAQHGIDWSNVRYDKKIISNVHPNYAFYLHLRWFLFDKKSLYLARKIQQKLRNLKSKIMTRFMNAFLKLGFIND